LIERLTLEDFFEIASEVSNKSAGDLRRESKENLIDSALHAPFAGFGDRDQYPKFETKVGVLGYRLMKAHGLFDGNKRTSVIAMSTFAEMNGYRLFLDFDEAFEATVDAAANTMSETAFVEFIAACVRIELPAS